MVKILSRAELAEQTDTQNTPAREGFTQHRRLLSIGKAAIFLGVSIDTLRNWEAQGKLQAIRSEGGNRRYKISDLKNFLQNNQKLVKKQEQLGLNPLAPTSKTEIEQTITKEIEQRKIPTTENLLRAKEENSPLNLSWIPLNEVIDETSNPQILMSAPDPKLPKFKRNHFITAGLIGLLLCLIAGGSLAAYNSPLPNIFSSKKSEQISQTITKDIASGQVLAVSTLANEGKYLEINADIIQNGNLAVEGEGVFAENLTAPNILYELIAGTNIEITGDLQRPTISSTGSNDTLQTVTTRGSVTTTGITLGNLLNLGQLASDPSTAINGATYYNTATNKFRCYQNASWVNCDTDTTSSGDIEGVTVGNGLSGGGSSGSVSIDLDVTTTSTSTTLNANSGLEVNSDGLSLLRGCSDSQVLSWDSANVYWECSTAGGTLTIEEGNTSESTSITTLDFLDGDFDVSTSGVEADITLAATLTTVTGVAGDFNIAGGDLTTSNTTSTLFNTTATTLSIGGAATTFNIGPTGSGASSMLLSGGSADTGCTLNGATGDLACTGNITGASTGTAGFWERTGSTLRPAVSGNGDNVTTAGNLSTTGSGTLSIAGAATFSSTINSNTFTSTALTFAGASPVITGSTTINVATTGGTGTVLLGGGSGSTGCTVDDSTGNLTCAGAITGGSSSTQGFWNSDGASPPTLSPVTTGSHVTTSGNISTTGSGTITSAGLLTGSTGLTVTGGTASLNASSNNNTNINTGTSTGAVGIGNSSAGALTLASGATSTVTITNGALTLSTTGASGGALNLNSSLASGSTVASAFNIKTTTDLAANDELFQIGDSGADFLTILGDGSTGLGDTSPDALLDLDSSATTGNIFGILSTTLTTGNAIDLTATYVDATGGTDSAIDINLTNNPSTSANTLLGLDLRITDADDNANTLYGSYIDVNNSSNSSTGTHTIFGGYYSATGKTAGSTQAIGVYGTATGADTNYGVYGVTSGASGNNYGVFAQATGSNTVYSIFSDIAASSTDSSIFVGALNNVTLNTTFSGINMDLSSNTTTDTSSSTSTTGISTTLDTISDSSGSNNITQIGNYVTATSLTTSGTYTGAVNWAGYRTILPNITQVSGATVNAYGVLIENGTVTTGGTVYGINAAMTGVGAGTLAAVNIGSITGGAGTEHALNIGSGWDTDINATTSLDIAVGGTLELYLDGDDFSPATSDSNSLGDTDNMWSDLFLASGGVINFGGDVTLTHASDALTVAGGSFTVTGSEGSDQLVLTAGDAAISDGSLSITDDDNAASFTLTNNTATTVGNGANTTGVIDLQSTTLSTGNFLNIETNGLTSGTGLNLSSTGTIATGGELVSMQATGITSGRILDISSAANTLTTGQLVNLSTTSTALTTGSLIAMDWTPGSTVTNTATGDLFKLTIGANGANNPLNFLNFYAGSTSVLSASQQQFTTSLPTNFTAAGDVAIAYDINFTNPTASFIKSIAPITIQSGETFNSSNLTLKTFNQGSVFIDSAVTTGTMFDLTNSTITSGIGVDASLSALTTGTGMQIVTNALTTGKALSITSTATGVTTGSLLNVSTGTTGAINTNGIVSLTATGAYTSTSNNGLLNVTANSTLTGTIQKISGTAITSGTALLVTGPTSTGVTGSFSKISSDVGSAGILLDLTPDFSGSAVTGYGLKVTGTDSTANANTDFGIHSTLTLTGNASKTGTGIYSTVTSSSTTANVETLTGVDIATTVTGIITTGIRNVYGVKSLPTAGAESTGGTTNVVGTYSVASGDVAAGGTFNGYGVYIGNGTFDTDGTSTVYGLYLEPLSGADENIGICFDCDTTFGTQTAATGIQWGNETTTTQNLQIFRSNAAAAAQITIQDEAGTDILNGSTAAFQINLDDTATYTQGLCHSGADGATGLVSIGDCDADPGDFAEDFGTSDSTIEAGDLVVIDPSRDAIKTDVSSKAWMVKSNTPYQNSLLGIVSTNPNEVIGQAFSPEENPRPIALNGRVPVKVSSENGPIQKGDYLTSSSVPGIAMKATQPGQVVGKALEGFDGLNGTTGKILTFVNVTFADPSNVLANLVFDEEGNLLATSENSTLNLGAINTYVNNNILGTNTTSLSQTISRINSDLATLNTKSLEVASTLETIDDELAAQRANLTDLALEQQAQESRVQSLESRLTSLEENQEASDSASQPQEDLLASLEAPELLLATGAATLTDLVVTNTLSSDTLFKALDITVSGIFKALGEVSLGSTTIAGDLTVDGTFSITEGSKVNALPVLYIQDSPLAEKVDFFNGLVTIDKEGKVAVKSITAEEFVVVSGKTSGGGTLAIGQAEVPIFADKVTDNSRIFITPTSPTSQTLSVSAKVTGSGFVVSSTIPATQNITFDWWMINEIAQGN
jgi:trimeric autotransporter adhesin